MRRSSLGPTQAQAAQAATPTCPSHGGARTRALQLHGGGLRTPRPSPPQRKNARPPPAQARRARHVALPRGSGVLPTTPAATQPRARRPTAVQRGRPRRTGAPTPGPAPQQLAHGCERRQSAGGVANAPDSPPTPPSPRPPLPAPPHPDQRSNHSPRATSPLHYPARGVCAWRGGGGLGGTKKQCGPARRGTARVAG